MPQQLEAAELLLLDQGATAGRELEAQTRRLYARNVFRKSKRADR
jgi:hypothetical protein